MSEKMPIQEQNVAPDKKNTKQSGKKNITTIISVALAAQVILAVFVGVFLFKRGYEQSKSGTEARIRQDAYDSVYNITERSNHVSNRVSISLSEIREKAELEVLAVDSSYLYTSDEQDKENNQTIWYKFYGSGTFTVDMRMTEFIVDNERHHVLVKAPAPTIVHFRENYDQAEKLLYKDGSVSLLGIISLNNGSVQEGEQIARKMLTQARVTMIKQLEMNPAYYHAAEDAATRIITNMIKSMNPDISQLSIDVEFTK